MKVNGNHVSPVELESALMQHPKIRDVGVIGVAVYVFPLAPLSCLQRHLRVLLTTPVI